MKLLKNVLTTAAITGATFGFFALSFEVADDFETAALLTFAAMEETPLFDLEPDGSAVVRLKANGKKNLHCNLGAVVGSNFSIEDVQDQADTICKKIS